MSGSPGVIGANAIPVNSFATRTVHPSPGPSSHVSLPRSTPAAAGPAVEAEQPTANLWDRIRDKLSWQTVDNQQVDTALDQYLDQDDYLPVVSERGSLYLYYIVEEVQKRGMPIEIALIPMVESTLDPFAYSPGKAAGLWQIMPRTGENLGLQQDYWFDGRRAVRDSTKVALDYLEQLHEDFDNDWLLAIAAYNAGEGRVARAVKANEKKGLPTDFWSLDLPRETQRYVPKVLALSQIVAEPETYRVDIPPVADAPAFEIAVTGGQIDLASAARMADISLDTLRELNPGQLRWATAPDGPQELLVPVGTSARLEQNIIELTPAERVRWRHYVIKPGDSLLGIATRFDTTVPLLRSTNKLAGNTIRAGQTLLVPASDWASGLAINEPAKTPPLDYRVQRGDSLAGIAGKYKVSVDDIVAWNSLDPDKYLHPGQQLTLHVGGT